MGEMAGLPVEEDQFPHVFLVGVGNFLASPNLAIVPVIHTTVVGWDFFLAWCIVKTCVMHKIISETIGLYVHKTSEVIVRQRFDTAYRVRPICAVLQISALALERPDLGGA